jgi:hypothetical protein
MLEVYSERGAWIVLASCAWACASSCALIEVKCSSSSRRSICRSAAL